jgi:uncharacterized membrane protein
MAEHLAPAGTRPLRAPGFLLGFALGGFFDGILLHQVLQWHHLLSGVQGLQDMRTQVLADGLFHLLMYFVAAWALVLLWRARSHLSQPAAGNVLWGLALVGFGTWHVIDSVFSHWLTGIHRIRPDSESPLFWDLLFLVVFGLLPLAIGWMLRRRGGGATGPGARTAAASLAITAVLAGPWAALPAGDSDELVVAFAPGVSSTQAFDALGAVGARVLWVDGSGGLWAVKMDQPSRSRELYARGALLVSNSTLGLGCFSWSRTTT